MIRDFKPYNRQELFEKIDAIEILKVENQVVTKYFGRVINTTNVSRLYEVFDIRAFMKEKISHIEKNFNISFYRFIMKRGVQYLTLLSDKVDINNHSYYKSFFILNSSDKSRRLNINLGLYRADNDTYFVGGFNNMFFCKKHLTGVTKAAEESAYAIDGESFDEQIKAIKSLVGEKVMLSKIREIIVDKDQQINHRKFDAFKNQLRFSKMPFTNEQFKIICTESEKITEIKPQDDFAIDAYAVFNFYMAIFRNQDSYIIMKETERIIRITQCFIRNEKLSQLLELV
jgi:hypothetical protein